MKLSKLQSGLSGEAEKTVRKGEAIMSVLRQGQFSPVGLAEQILLLYALHKGSLLSKTEDEKNSFRKEIYKFACEHNQTLLDEIVERPELTQRVDTGLAEIINAYFQREK